MLLPAQMGPASTWNVADFGQRWVNGETAAGGQVVVEVRTVPQDELWLIDFVRVSAETGQTPVRAFLCLDDPGFDVMGTESGEYDVADMNAAIHAPGGTLVLLVWEDMPAASECRGYVQWTVMRQAVNL